MYIQFTGIGMTDSEEDLLKSTVSMPYSDTAMTARTATDLKGIADKIVGYLCEGKDIQTNGM